MNICLEFWTLLYILLIKQAIKIHTLIKCKETKQSARVRYNIKGIEIKQAVYAQWERISDNKRAKRVRGAAARAAE
jgi:hypothetical protein